ncbi:glycosyltransferase [Nitritalea halalkaliphila]|uniref:glycosyltransferase n=1 Tax=Nitritalea halalkaliphila TaxID=590849 RepID=UPI000317E7E5|nr:glycosyltransferase [Nitritalea halalkaliphila]
MWLLYVALAIYLLAMSFVAFYSLAQAHLLGQFFRFRRGFRPPEPLADEALPSVTLQLPLYNERYVVQRLMAAVAQLDYPREKLEIQLLDDSTDDTGELLRAEMQRYPEVRFRYLHREDRVALKPER